MMPTAPKIARIACTEMLARKTFHFMMLFAGELAIIYLSLVGFLPMKSYLETKRNELPLRFPLCSASASALAELHLHQRKLKLVK